MYQSEWTQNTILHLFPHWNWTAGDVVDLWCYYNNADEVELYVNGVSQGVRQKGYGYHVEWRVTFEPGEIKAVSRKAGKTVCEQTIKTADAPDHIRLSVDYKGKNTTFINAEVVDKDGNLCPWAEDQIVFSISDNAKILGTDNGCQTSMERFTSTRRRAFFGKCMVVVKGQGILTARSPMLKSATISLLGQ
jgi:beta-galactosidase